ncbi:MAG TPA: hypothetical protein VEZ12_23805, partial [Herpetosiphonaceae bacterium]|nr:hypothetical protein [Herpetosiphonaceae bacterium]
MLVVGARETLLLEEGGNLAAGGQRLGAPIGVTLEVEQKRARSPARMVLTQATNGGGKSRRKGAQGAGGSATDAGREGSGVVVAADAPPLADGMDRPAEVSS